VWERKKNEGSVYGRSRMRGRDLMEKRRIVCVVGEDVCSVSCVGRENDDETVWR